MQCRQEYLTSTSTGANVCKRVQSTAMRQAHMRRFFPYLAFMLLPPSPSHSVSTRHAQQLDNAMQTALCSVGHNSQLDHTASPAADPAPLGVTAGVVTVASPAAQEGEVGVLEPVFELQ